MSKKTLLAVSVFSDVLDLAIVGQIPGLNLLIDLPVVAMHVYYAGPKGLWTLLELLPGVGFVPVFTMAAMSYPDEEQPPDQVAQPVT